jgi:hypothetical protein
VLGRCTRTQSSDRQNPVLPSPPTSPWPPSVFCHNFPLFLYVGHSRRRSAITVLPYFIIIIIIIIIIVVVVRLLPEFLRSSGYGTGSTQPREDN